jgi:hypothetical protein
MENNVNNKKLVYMMFVTSLPLHFTVLVLMVEHSVIKPPYNKFHSLLWFNFVEIKIYMKGSINRLFIEGADNGTTQQSVIIDCNNGTNVATLKAEKRIIENNLASYSQRFFIKGLIIMF